MDKTLFIALLLTLQVVCWWFGKRSAKNLSTQKDYYLGGSGFSFFPLMMTFIATQVGGGLILGAAEEAFSWGWWVLFYPLGQVLGLVGLGLGIGKRLANYRVSTVAQIFEVFYRSPLLKRLVSLFSILSLFLILTAQVVASRKFMVSLGVDSPLLFFLPWGLLIAYTALGGIRAVIATDVIQASFFVIVLLSSGIFSLVGNPLPAPVESPLSLPKISGWLFMPLMFSFIEQDMGQRCFAAQSNSILSRATLGAGIATLLIAGIPVYFGVLGSQLGIERTAGASFLMSSVASLTSPTLAAFVGCAVLAAILSTGDSLINAVGSNLSQDFFPSRSVRSTRWLSAVIGFGALFASYFFNNVVDLMIQAYELSVATLFVPLMAALFQKRPGNLFSALLAALCGAVGILFRPLPSPVPGEVGAILLSLVGYGISEALFYLQRKKGSEPKVIDN